LLNVAGDQIWGIYHASAAKKTTDKVAEIEAIMTAYFAPTVNVDRSVIEFRQMMQHQGECINAYIVRLRQTAAACGFDKLEDEVRLQVAIGSSNDKVRQKARAEKSTLEELVKLAKGQEEATSLCQSSRRHEDRPIKQESINQVSNREQ
jgi:hypothetical protein